MGLLRAGSRVEVRAAIGPNEVKTLAPAHCLTLPGSLNMVSLKLGLHRGKADVGIIGKVYHQPGSFRLPR